MPEILPHTFSSFDNKVGGSKTKVNGNLASCRLQRKTLVTCIKRSPFSCPVIEHFIWI